VLARHGAEGAQQLPRVRLPLGQASPQGLVGEHRADQVAAVRLDERQIRPERGLGPVPGEDVEGTIEHVCGIGQERVEQA
jgi:hypothetical protein